jgi:hypothetical protein
VIPEIQEASFMNSKLRSLLLLLLVTPLAGYGADELIPAGSLLQCRVSEPNFSSKTADIGDPILCQASPVEMFGRSVLPYGTYLQGRFEDYKDPGHFVGKGWMELKFDRMIIPPGEVVPLSAKVVYVPGMPVDKEGRIRGKGHAVRDTILWTIPVLWPIDLLTLPERGPRPKLKAETRLTLKIMDDVGVPMDRGTRAPISPSGPDPYGFTPRPSSSIAPNQFYQRAVAPVSYAPQPAWQSPAGGDERLTVLVMKDGNGRLASDYWFENGIQIRYIAANGSAVVIPIERLDLDRTVEANRRRGVGFALRVSGTY